MIYLCPKCEMWYGDPQPNCDNKYCGMDYEKVKELKSKGK